VERGDGHARPRPRPRPRPARVPTADQGSNTADVGKASPTARGQAGDVSERASGFGAACSRCWAYLERNCTVMVSAHQPTSLWQRGQGVRWPFAEAGASVSPAECARWRACVPLFRIAAPAGPDKERPPRARRAGSKSPQSTERDRLRYLAAGRALAPTPRAHAGCPARRSAKPVGAAPLAVGVAAG
jgi:hypothetical protein